MIYTFFIVFKISLEYFWIFCGVITVSFLLLFSLISILYFCISIQIKCFIFYIKGKSNAIKTWRFGDDVSPLSNANESIYRKRRCETQV